MLNVLKLPSSLTTPEVKKNIPLLVPDMPLAEEIFPWLKAIDKNRWYTNFGPLETLLSEKLLKSFPDHSNLSIALTSSGTTALEVAIKSLFLPSKSFILVPALTFPATASAVIAAGHIPLFLHTKSPGTLNASEVFDCLKSFFNIRAVIPVSLFGEPQDTKEWDRFTETTSIPVIVDAAPAWGNQTIGKTTSCIFSFHATKPLSCGEGGAVISSCPEMIKQVKQHINFGFSDSLCQVAGSNGKMSEYHAAVGLASLTSWPKNQEKRKQLEKRYHQKLAPLKERIHPLFLISNHTHAAFAVRLLNRKNKLICKELGKRGVQCRMWYLPSLPSHKAFCSFPVIGSPSSLYEELLCLPFHLFLSDHDLDFICHNLKELLF